MYGVTFLYIMLIPGIIPSPKGQFEVVFCDLMWDSQFSSSKKMTSSAAPKMLRKRDEAGNKFIVVQLSVMYWKRWKSLTILWLTIQEGMPTCYPWGKITMKPWASSLPVWQVWRGGPQALLGLANWWIQPILFNPFLGWWLKVPPKTRDIFSNTLLDVSPIQGR